MDEELIGTETAKFAKLAGFDIECRYEYNKYFQGDYSTPIRNKGLNKKKRGMLYKGDLQIYQAPTRYFLQKWLREEHNIHIVINITINGKWYFELYDLRDKRNAQIYDKLYEKLFHTFEEALEDALLESLKIILLRT